MTVAADSCLYARSSTSSVTVAVDSNSHTHYHTYSCLYVCGSDCLDSSTSQHYYHIHTCLYVTLAAPSAACVTKWSRTRNIFFNHSNIMVSYLKRPSPIDPHLQNLKDIIDKKITTEEQEDYFKYIEMFDIVKTFIKTNHLILYGGMALNE